MNKYHNLREHVDHRSALDSVTTVTRMFDAVLKTDRRMLTCMQVFKWNVGTKDEDGVSSNTHRQTHTVTHTQSGFCVLIPYQF